MIKIVSIFFCFTLIAVFDGVSGVGECVDMTEAQAASDKYVQDGLQQIISKMERNITCYDGFVKVYKPLNLHVCKKVVSGFIYEYRWTKEENGCVPFGLIFQPPNLVRNVSCSASFLVPAWTTHTELSGPHCIQV